MLAKTGRQAKQFVRRAFNRGFTQYNGLSNLQERWRKYRLDQTDFKDVIKGIVRLICKPEFARMHTSEKGYVYFQDFIPNNTFDIRVCVVGDKAFAIKRLVRDDDFRASGSGAIVYAKEEIDERCVKIAFQVNKTLRGQSMGFDFVFDENNNPLIVEIAYGYVASGYDACEGYWTQDMQWHEGTHFDFCGWMVEDLLK